MSHAREITLTFFFIYLSPLTSKVYLLVNLFEKAVHKAVRCFSCYQLFPLFIPSHMIVAGSYGITLAVHLSVSLSYIHPYMPT